MTDKPREEEELAEGTLLSHLIELRSRLVKMAASVIVLFAVLLPFNQRIFELVSKPLLAAVPSGQMIITGAAAPLLVPFKLTFLVALFLAMPVVLYQLWAFVAPGLYRKEKRFALPLLASSIFLFYAGVAFAYYVVFPLIFGFFGSINIEGAPWTPDIGSYLDFITSIVLAFGIAFEVPIATVLIVWAGLTTPQKLEASLSAAQLRLDDFDVGDWSPFEADDAAADEPDAPRDGTTRAAAAAPGAGRSRPGSRYTSRRCGPMRRSPRPQPRSGPPGARGRAPSGSRPSTGP